MQADHRHPRVLVCDPISETGIDMLQAHMDVDVKISLSPDELISIIPDYEAIVVRGTTQVTAEVLERGLNLKVIARAGAGLDNIDVQAAKEKGIQVLNSPDANSVAVAEHTMGSLLSLARPGTGLVGKTLGLIGFGKTGQQVAIRAQAFGVNVLVNQRRLTPELMLEAGVEAVDLNDLLEQSDFVSLHVPLRTETKGLISIEQLKLMKPTAYLINTARGGVVDEHALVEALSKNYISGAAIDVFAEAPTTHIDLAQHPRVIATPHIATNTKDAQRAAAVTVAQGIIQVLQDVEVENILPLRMVSMKDVFAHENTDPSRVHHLAQRLKKEGLLSNPIIVTEVGDRYMVLDGATRTAALRKLEVPHAVVQLASVEEGLQLSAWFHVIRQVEVDVLLQSLQKLPNIKLKQTEAEQAGEAMLEYGGLCYLQAADGVTRLVQPTGDNQLDALKTFTDAYIQMGEVSRTLEKDFVKAQHEYPDMAALVIFPEYTLPQVIQAAEMGREFSAGITRFVIPNRILRINVALDQLNSDQSLREKNRWLHKFLLDKQRQGTIRHYAESTYLLDE